jgi:hypothetical protein
MQKLSQSTIEKLEYYVYLLKDPRNNKVFYVGKGCGQRINHHLLGALEENTIETEKIKTIRSIQKSGEEVGLTILRHGLTEKEAFEIECAVIDYLGIENLTNLVSGHYSAERGIMSLEDIQIEYQAEEATFEEPVLLIRINRLYRPHMSSDEIYEVTRKHWNIGERGRSVKIVCAVYRGIIREVFIAKSWRKSSALKGRSYFSGSVAHAEVRDKYIHKSVTSYLSKGSQNPIKYVGF